MKLESKVTHQQDESVGKAEKEKGDKMPRKVSEGAETDTSKNPVRQQRERKHNGECDSDFAQFVL